MAWSTPLTAVSNAALTAAQWNASVRDNLLETVPAKATAAGQFFVATGANAIAARTPSSAFIATAQTTATITAYTDLATVGPQVTVTTGTRAMVVLSAAIQNSSAAGGGNMGYTVTGASSLLVNDSTALRVRPAAANAPERKSVVTFETGLTAGTNTFTAKYTTPTGGTATFSDRELFVLPF
ncbi:hypothetical protein ACIBCR_15150 [Micromonospora echinospora]|uniref:hypothetical protein n=1 Tax=Micromonospora echinospora TaxID=1877 RepID=UPI00379785CB